MAVFDLVTLAELKAFLPLSGTVRDEHARLVITRASRLLEASGDFRYVYRAPPEVEGAANLVNAQSWTDGAIAAAAHPSADGRTLIVVWSSATGGTLTAGGTVNGVATTEVFNAANGTRQHGVKFFEGTVTYTAAGATGAGTVSVGSSVGYVEYHTPPYDACIITALERPLQQVLSVNEDASRIYAASTELVVTTDYVLTTSMGRLRRVASAIDASWVGGRRAVKLVYSAGYAGTANVPQDLKGIALRLAALMFNETEKERFGLATQAGPMGSYTRFTPATVTKQIYDELWSCGYVRTQLEPTGQRDFDLEAA